MRRLRFKDWVFEVDPDRTRSAYATQEGGNSDGCICADCENYRVQKTDIFPDEVLELFESLGIDYSKESEAWAFEDLSNGLISYSGWFHFAGRIVEGTDCKRPISVDSWTFELSPVTVRFKIGFTVANDLSVFEPSANLVQVEFESVIPWLLDKARETDE